MYGYSRELYGVDLESKYFIPKKYFKIEILYKYDGIEKWVEIPSDRNIILNGKVRITITNESYIGKTIRLGIQRKVAMATGDSFDKNSYEIGKNI